MPEPEEKGVCCSIRMALIPRFAFFVLLLLPYQCKVKAESCSQTQCLLLPVGDDLVVSKFHFKASEKGVRLVYINLVIGNESYDPLELPDVFLPHRWVWANTIHEPMLSLHEDCDILSAGLLNYQVRSIEVNLTITISVFFTGSIPQLFFKVLTMNSNIIRWTKINR